VRAGHCVDGTLYSWASWKNAAHQLAGFVRMRAVFVRMNFDAW
jgi:hypothetical protein